MARWKRRSLSPNVAPVERLAQSPAAPPMMPTVAVHGADIPFVTRSGLHVDTVRDENLKKIADVLEQHSIPYFVVPGSNPCRHRIAVSQDDRVRLYEALLASDDQHLTILTKPRGEEPRIVAPVFRPLKNDRPSLTRSGVWTVFTAWVDSTGSWVIGSEHGCEIEFWHPIGTNRLRRREWNAIATTQSLDIEPAQSTIGGRSYPTLGEPSDLVPLDRVTFPIDAVITWVDGDDPAWRTSRDALLSTWSDSARIAPDATDIGRFKNRGELRYLLRSLEQFAPWFRHIFLVTNGQTPRWLDTDQPGLTVVAHTEIFDDADALPTFNSHAIESRLHHIPDLADAYVYFNDDVMLGRRLDPSSFFTGNGLSKSFFDDKLIQRTADVALGVDHATSNAAALIGETFGLLANRKLAHAPHPQRKSVLLELEAEYPQQFAQTAASRFRSTSDIAIPSSLYHYYAYLQRAAIPGDIEVAYLPLRRSGIAERMEQQLMRRDSDVICVNDVDDAAIESPVADDVVTSFLERYFPVASRYERS